MIIGIQEVSRSTVSSTSRNRREEVRRLANPHRHNVRRNTRTLSAKHHTTYTSRALHSRTVPSYHSSPASFGLVRPATKKFSQRRLHRPLTNRSFGGCCFFCLTEFPPTSHLSHCLLSCPSPTRHTLRPHVCSQLHASQGLTLPNSTCFLYSTQQQQRNPPLSPSPTPFIQTSSGLHFPTLSVNSHTQPLHTQPTPTSFHRCLSVSRRPAAFRKSNHLGTRQQEILVKRTIRSTTVPLDRPLF